MNCWRVLVLCKMGHGIARRFLNARAAFSGIVGTARQSCRPVDSPVDRSRHRVGSELNSLMNVRRQVSQIEGEAAEGTVAAKACLETRLEAFVLVRSRLIGV